MMEIYLKFAIKIYIYYNTSDGFIIASFINTNNNGIINNIINIAI